ncbi:MAG: sigma-70 family RNA polymerase sigma factor [Candidatus Tectomicrobia bacterium]|nr:sigma-70 family RNA polymerase sigma factor [Candidatus Tectomicrobia bacterium]
MSPPPEAHDDSAWVARCKAGDPDAFEPLVLRHAGRLRRLVWGLLGERREEAEDVVQEIFLKAYLALPRFREDAQFSTWLYRIAVNHCRDVGRRAPPPHVELDEARQESLADERSAEPGEELPPAPGRGEELRRLLGELSERQRRILMMREIEGLSYEEIGGILRIPPGTVRSRLNRARAGLLRAAGRRKEGLS